MFQVSSFPKVRLCLERDDEIMVVDIFLVKRKLNTGYAKIIMYFYERLTYISVRHIK
jgi:hypothetical protein